MAKRDDLIHQIFEGEATDPSRAAEARIWETVRSDLKAMKDQAPECQVTFEHLEGRLYAETVRTQPRSFWIPVAVTGCFVLGAAYFFGVQMGRQNSVIPTVAMDAAPSEPPVMGADLRAETFEELIPDIQAAPAPPEPAAEPAPSVPAPAVSAPVTSVPRAAAKSSPRSKAPRRSQPAAKKAVVSADPVAAAPAPMLAANTDDGQDLPSAGFTGIVGGGGGSPAAARAAEPEYADAAPAVVVVPSIPRGRSGAPVAIENPVMGDIVFGG